MKRYVRTIYWKKIIWSLFSCPDNICVNMKKSAECSLLWPLIVSFLKKLWHYITLIIFVLWVVLICMFSYLNADTATCEIFTHLVIWHEKVLFTFTCFLIMQGNILYRFPSLQRTASSQRSGQKEYVGRRWTDWIGGIEKFFNERKWQFRFFIVPHNPLPNYVVKISICDSITIWILFALQQN